MVATLGPSTRAPAEIRAVIDAGADVVRLNLAHDDPAVHQRTARHARQQAKDAGKVLGVLVDLPGPKMRTGPIAGGTAYLRAGSPFTLTNEDIEGDSSRASTTVEGLAEMVAGGEDIYLADGTIVLEVTSVDGAGVHTRVLRGGVLRSRKGMHVPGAERAVESFGDADRHGLEVGLRLGADLIGLSFVRDGADVERVRGQLPKRGRIPLLVAKIETRSGVDNVSAIIEQADAVMVARGDLGIQTPLARVPLVQKDIICACNRAGTPVITATQMLESMTYSPLPTRAEVADVANAVIDGTDALMLSEETAVGERPADAVATMAQIAAGAEQRATATQQPSPRERADDRVSWAVARAAVEAAEDLCVEAILSPTQTGSTPRRVAAFRPSMPVIALSGRAATLGALALSWGVVPLEVPAMAAAGDVREELERATAAARRANLVSPGALVAIVAGSPGPRAGRTDYVRIARA